MQTRTIIDKLLLFLSIGAGIPLVRWAVDAPVTFLYWMNRLTLVSGGVTIVLLVMALGLRRHLAHSRYQYTTGFDRIVRLHGLRFFLWFMAHHGAWIAVGSLLITTLLTLVGIDRWTLAISISILVAILYIGGGLVYSLFFLFDRRFRALGVCWQHPVDSVLHDWTQVGTTLLLQNRFEQIAARDLQHPSSVLRRLIAILDLAQTAGADRPIDLLEANAYAAAAQEAKGRGTLFAAVFASSLTVMLCALALGLLTPARTPVPAPALALQPGITTATALPSAETIETPTVAPTPTATPTATPMPSATGMENLKTPSPNPATGSPASTASGNVGTAPTSPALGATPTGSGDNLQPVDTPVANGQPTADLRTATSSSGNRETGGTATLSPASQSTTSSASATTGTPPASPAPGTTPMGDAAAENAGTSTPNGQPTSSAGAATGGTEGTPPASPPADGIAAAAGAASSATPSPNGQATVASATDTTPTDRGDGVAEVETPNPNQQPTDSSEPATSETPNVPIDSSSATVTPTSGNDASSGGTPGPNDQATSAPGATAATADNASADACLRLERQQVVIQRPAMAERPTLRAKQPVRRGQHPPPRTALPPVRLP